MAVKLGIVGISNSGKSFSRTFIDKGEEVFIIAPSAKSRHITDSEGKPIKRLNVKTDKVATLEEAKDILKSPSIHEASKVLISADKGEWVGNYIVCKLAHLEMYLGLVNDKMPHIKTIILPDITHFVSSVLAEEAFIKRKTGGEAYQRFWELAGSVLRGVIMAIDDLREDLVVVTEYHCDYNEVADTWEIFMPGGKMIMDKFKLDSYYDFMLYSHVQQDEHGEVQDYKFVTRKWEKYNARSAEIFKDLLIPNNLQIVLDKLREYNGI